MKKYSLEITSETAFFTLSAIFRVSSFEALKKKMVSTGKATVWSMLERKTVDSLSKRVRRGMRSSKASLSMSWSVISMALSCYCSPLRCLAALLEEDKVVGSWRRRDTRIFMETIFP